MPVSSPCRTEHFDRFRQARAWNAAFPPMALMGIPWHEAHLVGGMLGTRIIVNEFVAYAQLGSLEAPRAERAPAVGNRSRDRSDQRER